MFAGLAFGIYFVCPFLKFSASQQASEQKKRWKIEQKQVKKQRE